MALVAALVFAHVARALSRVWRMTFVLLLFVTIAGGIAWSAYNAFHFNPVFRDAAMLVSEEARVGEIIKRRAPGNEVYVYGHSSLETIMYYSENNHPLKLTIDSAPEPGDVIVLPPALHLALAAEHPIMSTELLFDGEKIRLLQVLSED